MKYLIVGLGNIGEEYRQTRHNIGFMILDALAGASNISFKTERYGDVAHCRLKNKQLVLLKPSTYMNLSGEAVRYWSQKEKIPVDHILILVDDLALPFGAIRLKGSGSDAGHNGLKNIALLLGTQAYPRLRFGIGSDFARGHQIDYVLGKFTPEQMEALPARLDVAIEAIKTFVLAGLQTAMCNYNNK
ncbi:MAG: aminoacyl-tRNA hydrolase [Bacteroidales bacterium]|nr:aminoacyl-tRNA hydrolase [Bacteroidales bacterium]MBD5281944.1 aminoacyl-tRNA hydrolase [Bacteroides sp.]MDE6032992.1 aminoacyl-tRNA hydrolase [Muribaculaceae bacterium]MBD5294099.1 aminoacyl-tRNA hydrolase [Bacteroides sp.]MBD5352602.1 aminoacyl-tRNA hydrolase [Bacteroides sp.]